MRVLLDTTYAARGPSGTGVYLAQLSAALRALGVDVLEAADPRRGAPAGGGLGSLRNWAEDRRWIALELPRRARAARAGVIHHPLPAHAPLCRTPQVITVHDLGFERLPAHFDPRFRAFARRAHRSAARAASAVVCVSEATAADVRALWGVPPGRVVVAPHGPGQPLQLPRRGRPRHLLYVGDAEPRKNLPALLDAYARHRARAPAPLPLRLAGRLRLGGLPPGVEVEAAPGPERLAELYAGAAALVHPSLHEGFGLTLAEAMAAGVPVAAGRSPGVTETCGEAALYFDPRDPEDGARALDAITADAALRRRLAARGRRRAAELSWERSARAHLRAYTLAAESP